MHINSQNLNHKAKIAKGLIDNAINNVLLKIKNHRTNLSTYRFTIKSIFAVTFLCLFIFFIISKNDAFLKASIRLFNPTEKYEIPLPFSLNDMTRSSMVLDGDSLKIMYAINGAEIPDSIKIIINQNNSEVAKTVTRQDSIYSYTMKNLFSDFTYYAEYQSNSFLKPWKKN